MKSNALVGFLGGIVGAIAVGVVGAYAARNGSGTYSLPAGNPVVSGTTISSTWANNTLSDIATALTNSIAKNGETTPTAHLPMGGYRHTNVANAAARNQYATVDQLQDGELLYLGSVAGTNTITGSLTPAIGAYAAGMLMTFTPANTNTGAATINVNGLGAIDVLKFEGDALVTGDLVSGVPALLLIDAGADDAILLNPNSIQALRVYKSAAENVAASTTLQNDDHLVVAVEASTVYQLDMFLYYVAGGTGGFKMGFTLPSGASGRGLVSIHNDGGGPFTSGSTFNWADITSAVSFTHSSGGDGWLHVRGEIAVSSTAGNAQFQFAQQASNSSTGLQQYSWMTLTKL